MHKQPLLDLTNFQPMDVDKPLKLLEVECEHVERVLSVGLSYWTCVECGAFLSFVLEFD